jgi:DNA-binding transcriptional MerR regulator
LKLAPSQFRFCETKFPELTPKMTRKGDRRYILKDIETIEKINQLLKIQGFTIKVAKDYLKKNLDISIGLKRDWDGFNLHATVGLWIDEEEIAVAHADVRLD